MARVPMTLGAGVHLERTCKPCLPPGQATGNGGEGLHGCFPRTLHAEKTERGLEERQACRGCVERQTDSSGKAFQWPCGPVGPAPGRQRLPTCRPVWVLLLIWHVVSLCSSGPSSLLSTTHVFPLCLIGRLS